MTVALLSRRLSDDGWKEQGACFGDNDDTMFPPSGQDQRAVVARCQALCPVQEQCLTYALNTGQEWGVWGGTTERERRRLAMAWPRPRP